MSIPIDKTLDDVRQGLFSKIAEIQEAGYIPTALNLNRGLFRGLIELWAWGLYQLYLFLVTVLTQAYPSTATGAWLDLHCTQVEISRLAATQATGTCVFYREDTDGNVVIPEGRVVRTRVDGLGNIYRFVTTEEVVLPDGQEEISVTVKAESYGSNSNVAVGMICELVTVIEGVDGVRNDADWLLTEGSDEEDDDRLRERYWLAWASINGCTADAYRSWAMSVTGVAAVSIMDEHPRGQGTVDVVICGTAGIPTQDLVDQVTAVMEAKRPINDDTLVTGPDQVDVDIDIELELTSGDAAQIILEAENRIHALFFGSSLDGVDVLEIGQDVTQDMLSTLIMAGSTASGNVKKVNFTTPAEDVVVPDTGLAVLTSLDITYVEVSE